MMVTGRSLPAARGVAAFLGAVSVAAPYAAMRAVGVSRPAAVAATAIAMALPWNAWLGVAPVPEGWAGAVGAAGDDGDRIGKPPGHGVRRRFWRRHCRATRRGRCARVLGVVCLVGMCRRHCRATSANTPGRRPRALVIAGPLAWMAWNAHAHGSPTHFVTRVTAFRRAIGAANVPLRDKLLDYPRALLLETPGGGGPGGGGTDRDVRRAGPAPSVGMARNGGGSGLRVPRDWRRPRWRSNASPGARALDDMVASHGDGSRRYPHSRSHASGDRPPRRRGRRRGRRDWLVHHAARALGCRARRQRRGAPRRPDHRCASSSCARATSTRST